AGQTLTPSTPVVLTFKTGDGLEFTRTYAIDQNYMITATDVVHNASQATRVIRPFGVVRRQGLPADYIARNVQQGFEGVLASPNHIPFTTSYPDAQKFAQQRDRGEKPADARVMEMQGKGGWFGFSDHYWLTAIIPNQNENVSANFDARSHPDRPLDLRAG